MKTLKKFLAISALFLSSQALAADVVVEATVDGETVGVFSFLLEPGGEGAMQFEAADSDVWIAVMSEDGESIQVKGLEGVDSKQTVSVSPGDSNVSLTGSSGEVIELAVQFLD